MVAALKAAIKYTSSDAFSGFIGDPIDDFASAINNGTDAAFEQYAREHTTTVWHPSCTTPMAPYNSTDGVVNPDFTVKGTVGLRIVDASVFVRLLFYAARTSANALLALHSGLAPDVSHLHPRRTWC